MAQDVAVAVGGQDAEVGFAGRVPAVLDGRDLQSAVAQVLAQRALIGFEARIGFYTHGLIRHSVAPAQLCQM